MRQLKAAENGASYDCILNPRRRERNPGWKAMTRMIRIGLACWRHWPL
jgi:hypothetical protein